MLDTYEKVRKAIKKLEPAAVEMLKEYSAYHSSYSAEDDDAEAIRVSIALSHAISARRQADAMKVLVILLARLMDIAGPNALGNTDGQLDVPLQGQLEGKKNG